MQTDDCDFEILPDEGPTEEQKHDLVWLDSLQGREWANSQRPPGKFVRTQSELSVIIRRLQPIVPTTHPEGRAYIPKYAKKLFFSKGSFDMGVHLQGFHRMELRRGIREWDLWCMPYEHTAYVSHVHKYWHWYRNIRSGHESWRFNDYMLEEQMYVICLAIARERQNTRQRNK